MIDIGEVNRAAFRRWRSCRWSGDFVKFVVKPYGDGETKQIRQRGYCVQKRMDVDFGADCGLGSCWTERRGPKRSKSALQKIRAKKAAERRKRFNAKRIELNLRSKGIDEY